MATFYANPDEKNELWIERAAVEGSGGFRIWHYIFFCFSAFTIIVVLTCCCIIKIRVPRTKQEIEADYCRKKLAEKFRERLRMIRNQEMDAMDLERALHIIQEDYNNMSRNHHQFVPTAPTNVQGASESMAQSQTFSNVIETHRHSETGIE